QAEDGIRDFHVTGVQTCALPISVTHVFDFAPDCLPDSSTPQPAIAVATVAAIAPTRCALAYSNVLLTASTGVAPPSIASKIARSVAPLIASARDRADALTNPSVSASS